MLIDDAAPQLGLFDGAERDPVDPIESSFREFHAKNPHVLRRLVAICRDIKRAGLSRGSIGLVFEQLRYQEIKTTGQDYKLNNNFRSRYARLIMAQHADLDGWFELRALAGERG